jgi:hypothetical protein
MFHSCVCYVDAPQIGRRSLEREGEVREVADSYNREHRGCKKEARFSLA